MPDVELLDIGFIAALCLAGELSADREIEVTELFFKGDCLFSLIAQRFQPLEKLLIRLADAFCVPVSLIKRCMLFTQLADILFDFSKRQRFGDGTLGMQIFKLTAQGIFALEIGLHLILQLHLRFRCHNCIKEGGFIAHLLSDRAVPVQRGRSFPVHRRVLHRMLGSIEIQQKRDKFSFLRHAFRAVEKQLGIFCTAEQCLQAVREYCVQCAYRVDRRRCIGDRELDIILAFRHLHQIGKAAAENLHFAQGRERHGFDADIALFTQLDDCDGLMLMYF